MTCFLLFHLTAHKTGSTFGENLLRFAHFPVAVFAAQDDGTDDIAFTENGTDDLRIAVVHIFAGNLDMFSGLLVEKNILPLVHDFFQLAGNRSADGFLAHTTSCGDDLIPVSDADTVAGGGGQSFRIFLCKGAQLTDRRLFF